MRRPATWVAVGVVLVVGVAAAADALRQEAAEPSPEPATRPGTTTRAAPGEGLRGVLFYTDEQCQLRAVRFPELSPTDAPQWNECSFSLSPDGTRVGSAPAAWHPGATAVASESEGSIAIGSVQDVDTPGYSFLGSAPAFNANGLLSFASAGQIRGMHAGCPPSRDEGPFIEARTIRNCSHVLVSREAIRRAALRHPNAPDAPDYPVSVSVQETAWLGEARLAAMLTLHVRAAGDFDLLALFEGGGIVETIAVFESLSALRASPAGGYFGVLTQSRAGVLLFDREGRALPPPPPVGQVKAFDWSPDEDWIALATPQDVYIDLTERRQFSSPPPLRRLGIVAGDLAWR